MNNALSINNDYSKSFCYNLEINKYIYTIFNQHHIVNNVIIKKRLNYLVILVFFNFKKTKSTNKNKESSQINSINVESKIDNYLKVLNLDLKTKIMVIQSGMKLLRKGQAYSKIVKAFKKKRRHPMFYLVNIILFQKNVKLLNFLLKENLSKTRRHKQYMVSFNNFMNDMLDCHKDFIGYKIQLKGRLNGIERSQKLSLNKGRVPLNSFGIDTHYNFSEFLTQYGICSIKSWLVFQEPKKSC